MPAAARARCAIRAALLMAPVLRSSVLVLSSTRSSLYLPLTAARASSASAIGCVAALVCSSAFSLAAGSSCRRRLALAVRCTCVARGARAAFVGARASLDPILALLAADRGSCQRRLGAQLHHCARPCGGALVRRRLAMLAAARARCVMHAALLMAPVLRSSVLVLSSTRPSLYLPLTAARASAASALGCVAALVRSAALSLAADSPCRRRLGLAARCTCVARGARAALRPCACSPRTDPHSARHCPRLERALPRRSAGSLRSSVRRRSRSPPARHASGGSRSLRDARSVARSIARSVASLLVLSSTRPSLYSPLTAARATAASALSCVTVPVRAAALSLAAGSPCRRRLANAARCTRRRSWRPCCIRRCSFFPRPDPRFTRR